MIKITPGTRTERFKVHITREDIQLFARSIGFMSGIHVEEDAAQAAGFSSLVAPPTYPVLCWHEVEVPWLARITEPLLHGKQSFHYDSPITAGNTYVCQLQLVNATQRFRGEGQLMTRLEQRLEGFRKDEQSERVFTADSTFISFQQNLKIEKEM
ncbi:FAS1-like dehydratase domain-containing protein [Salsuginibacillus kocurii]|uniref:FAS1-like dehydratase domain-containing protein n=1 Tax=Salsuginibacillus kocurii TaxID=427078 RepID=UPI0003605818|nr:MaoC family dehydratase N-terminal domain-containing protein [Salsuginibacillus kocurii]